MDVLGTSTELAVAYAVALFALVLVPGFVTLSKGHRAIAAAGLLVGGIVWWIAVWRLARPDSWWARSFYGPEKLHRAQLRDAPSTVQSTAERSAERPQ